MYSPTNIVKNFNISLHNAASHNFCREKLVRLLENIVFVHNVDDDDKAVQNVLAVFTAL